MRMMSHSVPGKKAIGRTCRATLPLLAVLLCAAELACGAPTGDGVQALSDSTTTVTLWRSFGRSREEVSPWVERTEVFSKPLPAGCVRIFLASFWGRLWYEDLPATTTVSIFGGHSSETLGDFVGKVVQIKADYEDQTADGGFIGLCKGEPGGLVVLSFCNPRPNLEIVHRGLSGAVDVARKIEAFIYSRRKRTGSP